MAPMHLQEQLQLPDLSGELAYSSDKFQSQILSDQGFQKVILFAFSEGQELKTHTTPIDALLLVLEGECTFTFPEEEITKTLKLGQIIKIPAKVPHSLKALSNFKMVLIK